MSVLRNQGIVNLKINKRNGGYTMIRGILLCVVALAASSASAQDVKGLKLVWELPTPKEFPQGIVVDARGRPFLHVALKNGGLLVLDISNKERPKVAAKLGTDRFADLDAMHLTQRGDHLYLALGDFFNARGTPAGFAIVDVRNPAQPRVVSVWKSKETLHGSAIVIVEGNHAYLGAMSEGVMIFDVSKPDKIQHVSTFQPDVHFPRKNPNKVQHPNARGLVLRGNLLYVAYDAGGLRVLDVADKRKPKEIGRYINKKMEHKQQAYNNLALEKNLLYIACDYAGLEIVDVSDPRNIRPVGWWNPWEAHLLKSLWFNSAGHANQIELDVKTKRAYLSAGGSELQIVDVSTPSQPRLAGQYRDAKGKVGVWGLTLGPDRVYLAYVTAVIPFAGTWAGVKAVGR